MIREGILGRYNLIKTPWGHRLRLYADFTASGQDIKLIDTFMEQIKENYSNTHTESSHDGQVTNNLFNESKRIILECCKVTSETHAIISVGSGSTAAMELM